MARPSSGTSWRMQTTLLPLLRVALLCLAVWAAATNGGIRRDLFLLAAAVVAIVLCALQWRFFTRISAQERRHQQYLTALERLSEIATAISARIDSQPQVLDELATAARDLLSMDRSGVVLMGESQSIRVVAFAGAMPRKPPVTFSLLKLPLCKSVVDSGQAAFIEDVQVHRSPVNLHVTEIFDARSMAILPLVIGERRLGFLALSSSDPHRFDDWERRLAELMGRTASVILSNSELYSRMATALRDQQRLSEQREAIFAANTAIYRAGNLQAALGTIVELAPRVLGVDLCVVSLSEGEDRMRVAAITPPVGRHLVGRSFVQQGTNAQLLQATKRMLVVEQAMSHPGVQPVLREQLGVRSIAYLPLLRGDGALMGVLGLIRRREGSFAKEQLDLAELFTSRAAAAIENAQLLEQTERDAQTKAILLRELNHRVKNNLASIIGLLSFDEPELSPAVRQWLDHAIERIRTMADAHQMFTGSPEGVNLSVLVERTISSLSVALPSTASIHTELTDDIPLEADRAVSVAMVLHELCYNAIVHGLAGKPGTVTIRGLVHRGSNGDPGGRTAVVLEVINALAGNEQAVLAAADSKSNSLADVAGQRSAQSLDWLKDVTTTPAGEIGGDKGGIGLLLVEGLVTRELKGAFSLHHSEGASLARVWFPMGQSETGAAEASPLLG